MDAWDGSFEYEPFLLLLFGDPFFASLKIAQSRDQSWKRGAEVAEATVQTETAHSCITKDDNGSRRKTWSISPLFFLYLFRWLGILACFCRLAFRWLSSLACWELARPPCWSAILRPSMGFKMAHGVGNFLEDIEVCQGTFWKILMDTE